MNRTSISDLAVRHDAPSGGFCRRLPEVSATERDFWRRAVAEERERLDLGEGMGARAARPDAH
ncbi:MAG: hypothetical protein H6R27_483 [Proteobacteria bacterium]|nr:hypothetical protein [Pseudomonadota bacterium]